jgi:hypothetical protein
MISRNISYMQYTDFKGVPYGKNKLWKEKVFITLTEIGQDDEFKKYFIHALYRLQK